MKQNPQRRVFFALVFVHFVLVSIGIFASVALVNEFVEILGELLGDRST